MTPASLPHDEPYRLAALRALNVLDSRREAEFDALVRVAAAVCEAPVALISLIDGDRQWFKANIGLPLTTETSREVAFCAHAILDDLLFEVPDATADARFADNPLVMDDPHVRFYAAAPLKLRDGHRVGTLCVMDRVPRRLTDMQRHVLADLAEAAARALDGRSAIRGIESLAAVPVEKHEPLRSTPKAIGDAVITTDAGGRVLWLNPVAETLTGWTTESGRGRDLAQVFRLVASTRAHRGKRVKHQPAPGGDDVVQAQMIGPQGFRMGVETSTSAIFTEEGAPHGSVIVFRDVTQRRREGEETIYRATHDALTGLFNRSEFETRLERLRQTTLVGRPAHTLLYIDLDRFKLINDACGHAAGDRLMKKVAAMLKDSVRAHDVVARMGGDEFAILLESCAAADACRIAQDICDAMTAYRFVDGDRSLRVGTSIGLIAIDGHWASAALLLQSAGAACYAAKDAGRNRVHVWSETEAITHQLTGDVQWAARIEEALDEDRFVLYAQRIESLQDADRGLYAEVLLRMVNRDGSLNQPAAFLPAAERFQLAPLVDRWVLRHALEWMRGDAGEAPIERLSVNLSGQSIGDSEFCSWALAFLSEAGPVICSRLCLEITETAAVTHMKDAAAFIREVRVLGVETALDDFGAGASSFGYLKQLVVDCIKIDGQFVRGLIDDPLNAAAVRCFVDIARLMGVHTVAEFVDRPEVLARLREMGVDYAQGYLLHRPAPLGELLQRPCGSAIPITRAKPAVRSRTRRAVACHTVPQVGLCT